MRRVLLPLIPLLALACTDQATAPEQQQTPAVSANWMNNPDNGNPRMFRYQSDFFAAWNDNGLRATHRTQPVSGFGCFDFAPAGAAEWNEQVLGPIDLTSRWIANVQADVWITVRDLTQPGTCAGNLLIAEGWGRLAYNDNDELVLLGDRNNTNAWSFRASGDLTAPDGSRVRYSGHAHFTYNPNTQLNRGVNFQVVVR